MQHNIKRLNLSQEAKRLKLEKDRSKIQQYKSLTQQVLDSKKKQVYNEDALESTTQLLALNPEFYTIWNYRREILSALFRSQILDQQSTLESDLKLVMAQMKRFPKCYWIWNHRQWCLFELQSIGKANWEYELAIVSKLLEMDSRNFHGWQYRRFVVDSMESYRECKDVLALNLAEFEYTTNKINKNISNFSAWHNRSKLIIKIFQISQDSPSSDNKTLEIFKNPSTLVNHELSLVKTGMYMDADDTSVWLYLLWLVTEPFFVEYLRGKGEYTDILQQQLSSIRELNELERDDHPTNQDNVWCLKTIVHILGLLRQDAGHQELIDDEIKSILGKLIQFDPLRKGRYLDQLNGEVAII